MNFSQSLPRYMLRILCVTLGVSAVESNHHPSPLARPEIKRVDFCEISTVVPRSLVTLLV